ncbi:MAG: hypothetical protein KBT08_10420 [Bacteroidales bacterium]|nr:hypothetical protein [Candidatus Cryptobacteroides onthequi]
MSETKDYGLDLHCSMILDEYREILPEAEEIKNEVISMLRKAVSDNNLMVAAVEGRVKTESSLAGKLELKGNKYHFLSDITDIIGVRVITFYTDDVDKIAAIAENLFEVDWENSVDKRKMHEIDSFGYNSLHYICRLPGHEQRFEIQMRTTLQHMWATMHHDTGYKSDVEIPSEYIRTMNRLAGMLELADDEFARIRTSINDYRRKVQALVEDGDFEKIPLNGDTYRNYLTLNPFDKLNKRIAAINQAEVHSTSLMPYLEVFHMLGFKTLGDIERLIRDHGENAYQLAVLQIGGTDLDIISASVAVQDLCIVYELERGGGILGLKKLFDTIDGESAYNRSRAERVISQASHLRFMQG